MKNDDISWNTESQELARTQNQHEMGDLVVVFVTTMIHKREMCWRRAQVLGSMFPRQIPRCTATRPIHSFAQARWHDALTCHGTTSVRGAETTNPGTTDDNSHEPQCKTLWKRNQMWVSLFLEGCPNHCMVETGILHSSSSAQHGAKQHKPGS